MKKYLTINKFSKITGIESTTLRYWDKLGLFSPIKRNENTKYRYYSLQQIITVKFMVILIGLGIPINTIISKYKNKSPEKIIELIEEQKFIINDKLFELNEIFSVMFTRGELIKIGMNSNIDDISVVDMPMRSIAFASSNKFGKDDDFYKQFINFCKQADDFNINLSFPIGGFHQNSDSFFEYPNKPESFFSLNSRGNKKWESGKYLVGYAKGYYGNLDGLAKRMKQYAQKNSIILSGPVYVLYLHDELCTEETSEYLAQISIAIKK